MHDPRFDKLAHGLVNFSTKLTKGEKVLIDGFDILSDGLGGNTAYALLTATSGIASLYTVNLNTGAATVIGVIGQAAASRPFSLAIPPAVPEPGTLLFGFAILGACLKRNRRK